MRAQQDGYTAAGSVGCSTVTERVAASADATREPSAALGIGDVLHGVMIP